MKQTILLFLLALLPLVASADAVEIDGIYYNLVNKVKTAEVTSNPNGYTGEIIIPETVTYNDVTYDVTSIGESAFPGGSGLTSISIPNSVTKIGDYSFRYCSGLTSITIPNSVTSIGREAFLHCSKLTSITIPNSVTSIGYRAFSDCTDLKEVHISDLTAWCNITFNLDESNPLYNGSHLYLNEEEITDLVIPNSVTTIGNFSFLGCNSLTSVTIPNSVTSIGGYAFENCTSLTSITIANSVTSIMSGSFRGCSGLTSITIPNSVTSIGGSAFWGCSSLTSITIPNSVTSIEGFTFYECSGLTSISIPNSVTSIGEEAFYDCSSLTSITIPNSVTSIGKSAFSGCPELTDVYCYAEKVPSTASTAFQDSYIEYATLHVPEAAIEKYKTTAPWSSVKKIVSIESGGQLLDMTISVTNAFGKVTYGTTEIKDGQQTFNVKEGSDVVLTLTPNDGFKVDQVMMNGEDKTASVVNGQLTLSNVKANLIVSVSFGVAGEFTKVTIGANKVATFCAVADVDFTTLNLKAYTGGGFNRQTGVLTMMRVYDVPAGTGLLLKGEPGTYFVPYSQSYSIYSNLLKGVIVATNINATENSYVNYVLSNGSQGVGFYKVGTAGASLEAGHAYLQIPAEAATSRNSLRLRFDDEDEATGISASLTNSEERIANSAIYDLQGRRVEQPQPGLYIRNGKKVIIK